MKAANLTRYTFDLGGRTLGYSALRRYVCNDCGGTVSHRFTWDAETETTVDSIACAACGCEEMVTERTYLEQISDGWEVMDGLPEALRAKIEGDRQCQSATEATDDLFD